MNRLVISRRAMTLPELLVVVAIIGLLAVSVLPVLDGSRERTHIRDAADAVVTHASEVAAKAMGSSNGASTWYETELSGAGNDQAVVKLGFGRPRSLISGTASLTPTPLGGASLSSTPPLPAAIASCLPAPIEFIGTPGLLLATSATTVSAIDTSLNRTIANTAIPLSPTNGIRFVLHLPPRPRLTAAARYLPNNMAIDFAWSSIGVPGFTQPASKIVAGSGGATGPRCIAITYDRTGRPNRAWYSLGHPDSGTPPPAWRFITLDSATPVVLLVGPRSNAGNGYVASPNEDDPGANWQNPDARWVLIDPRTSIVRSIETYAKAATRDASLRFVLDVLKNRLSQ